MTECRLCAAPAIDEDDAGLARIIAFPKPLYPNHRVVMTRQHHDHLGQVSPPEWAAVGTLIGRLSDRMREAEGAERAYVLAIGDADDHVCHFHVIPRTVEDPLLGPHVFGPQGWNASRGV